MGREECAVKPDDIIEGTNNTPKWKSDNSEATWVLEPKIQAAYVASQLGALSGSTGVSIRHTSNGFILSNLRFGDAQNMKLLTQVGRELGNHTIDNIWLTLLDSTGRVVAANVPLQASHLFTQRAQVARALALATNSKYYQPWQDASQKVGLKDAIDQVIQLDSYIGQIEYDTVILNIQFGFRAGWNI